MDIKLAIKPEDIERHVMDSIIQSAIGERIRTSVLNALRGYTFDKAMDEAVTKVIKDLASEMMMHDPDLKVKVRDAVTASVTEKHISSLLKKALNLNYSDTD